MLSSLIINDFHNFLQSILAFVTIWCDLGYVHMVSFPSHSIPNYFKKPPTCLHKLMKSA